MVRQGRVRALYMFAPAVTEAGLKLFLRPSSVTMPYGDLDLKPPFM